MKTVSKNKVFGAACVSMASFGMAMLCLGAILPSFILKLDNAVVLPQFFSLGMILGVVIFGPIMDKYGYKWLFVGGSVVQLIGLLGLAHFDQMGMLVASVISLGLGSGIVNGLTNAIASDLYIGAPNRGAKLSFIGACYGIGALLWTLACVFVDDYTIPLYGVATIMALLVIYIITLNFPEKYKEKEEVDVATTSSVSSFKLLFMPGLLLVAFTLFFQSGIEGMTASYLPTFFIANGVRAQYATFSLTMLSIGVLSGRLLMTQLLKFMKDTKVLYLYLFTALAGLGLLSVAKNSIPLIYTAMVLLGIGIGATFPVMLGHLGNAFRSNSGKAFSIAIFVALCGQFTFNYIVGNFFIVDSGMSLIYIGMGAVLAVVLISIFAIRTVGKTKI